LGNPRLIVLSSNHIYPRTTYSLWSNPDGGEVETKTSPHLIRQRSQGGPYAGWSSWQTEICWLQ